MYIMKIKQKTTNVYVDSHGNEHTNKISCLEHEFDWILNQTYAYHNEDLNISAITSAEKLNRFIKENPRFIKDLMSED